MNKIFYMAINVVIITVCLYILFQNIFVRQIGMTTSSIASLIIIGSSLVAAIKLIKEKEKDD
ncbi:hypothetical protein V1503_23825 [Bacillus sp. SCS-151]|uniref:hypothetical protein n=1 Tax=Nanhaiella sioensis TaxID=3115293 RepID=UPI00397A6004